MPEKPASLSALRGVLPYVFGHMDVAAIVADADRRIIMINDAALEMFGYDEAELKGHETRIIYADPDDFEEQGRKRFNKEAQEAQETYITRYRCKNGNVFEGETLGGPIKSTDDENLAFVGFIRDVTHRVATEQTLSKLHSITSSRDLNFQARVDAILRLGTEHFGLPIGIFSHIHGNLYTVMQAVHPDDALTPGMTFEFANTYCSHVFDVTDVRGFYHVGESDIRAHPCYQSFQLEAYLGSTIFVDGHRYGTLNFSSPEPTRPFRAQDIELVRLFAEWIGHELARKRDLEALENAKQELEILARTDALTGLFNRGYMEDRLSGEIDRSRRYKHPLTVALFDFDHFKKLNDTYGHAAGDEALKLFAATATRMSRKSDVVARWGGEEFLAVFPSTGVRGAVTFLERLSDEIRDADFAPEGESIPLTMSIGVASAHSDDDLDTLVSRADAAMYLAKTRGRDQIRTQSDIGKPKT
ncbi:hypothetical protein RE428_04970 [Marinobacter nanhaiticus D15-8W]|nr:diguanylate cyclase [Marinobacter nanhaiticus]BES69479.1 hypothetical protein RE428_04970 [Marinobacter nanhaiticus D15-8W]